MWILPNGNSLNGLIHGGFISGTPFCSNTNLDDRRVINPILHDSNDRWCSKPSGQYTSQYWGMNFDKAVHLTHFSLQNKDNAFISSVLVQGRLRTGKWLTISDIANLGVGGYGLKTIKTMQQGPFNAVNFTSRKNTWDGNGYFFLYF